jgi:hypothetical protein
MVKDDDYDIEEYELDKELVEKFASKIEKVVNQILENVNKNPFPELLTVLLSMGAQLSIELETDKKGFIEFASEIYDEAKKQINEKEEEPERIVSPDKLN